VDGVVMVLAGVLGATTGSFGNVVVSRVPERRSVVRPRSACPRCGSAIRALDNIPILSWLALRGRCRTCRAPIPVRYLAVEVLMTALFVVSAERVGVRPVLPALLVFVWGSVVLSAIDVERRIVPRRVLWPLAVATSGLLVFDAALADRADVLAGAAVGALAGWLVLGVVHLVRPAGMGRGDVRLAGWLGSLLGALGAARLFEGFFLAFLLGGLAGVLLVATRRARLSSSIPFAPFLCAGALLAVFLGPALTRLWLG
jgi:leader peptidase (prepilin peptidase)/N-methyltransferase